MKLVELYNKIISKEPYNNMNVFFESYESFEEIPIVSRYSRLDFLKEEMNNDKVSELLVSTAIFLMNSIKIMGPTDKPDFYAITFTDFDGLDVGDVIIPNIFVYPGPASNGFVDKIRVKKIKAVSQEMKEVKKIFDMLGFETVFDFHESRFYDSASKDEIVRIFAVPKISSSKIKESNSLSSEH